MRRFLRLPLLAIGLLLFATQAGWAERGQWRPYQEPEFGVWLVYPAALFAVLPREEGAIDQVFTSPDGSARLAIAAWRNEGGTRPRDLKNALMKTAAEDRSFTYTRQGRTWFVLSGYEGDDIHYQKVMYSCGGAVVSTFALAYPKALRARYDPVVERMEDSFRPGRNCQ